jgi:hypothetical protein
MWEGITKEGEHCSGSGQITQTEEMEKVGQRRENEEPAQRYI